MQQQTSSTEILARWRCEPELWRDFVEYDSNVYWRSVRSAKHFIIAAVIVTMLALFLFTALPYLITGGFGRSVLEFSLVILVLGGIAILVGIFVWNQRSIKQAKLKAASGELSITPTEFKVEGVTVTEWTYGYLGWRFYDALRESVDVVPGKKIDILTIKFVAFQPGKGTPLRDEGEQRIPIPSNKLAEADAVIRRLCAERDAAESAWLLETGGYKHDFLNRACRKCGTEIERTIMTSRECVK